MGAGASVSEVNVARVATVFSNIDTNKNNFLDMSEISAWLKGSDLTEAEINVQAKQWIYSFDENADAKVTLAEFETFFGGQITIYGEEETEKLLQWFEMLSQKLPSAKAAPTQESVDAANAANMAASEASIAIAAPSAIVGVKEAEAEAPAAAPAEPAAAVTEEAAAAPAAAVAEAAAAANEGIGEFLAVAPSASVGVKEATAE